MNSQSPSNPTIKEQRARPAAPDPLTFRLYVLVRQDLPPSQRAVQAAHAALQLVMAHRDQLAPFWGPWGPHLVIYAIPGNQLEVLAEKMPPLLACFREPDQGNVMTAIAYWGPPLAIFQSLRLL